MAYKLRFNDANLKFEFVPQGNWWLQILLFILLATVPIVSGLSVIWIFMGSFVSITISVLLDFVDYAVSLTLPNTLTFQKYKVKINLVGFKRQSKSPLGRAAKHLSTLSFDDLRRKSRDSMEMTPYGGAGAVVKRRTVLIATMEYNIDDWNIKIKIGGLGVMAQLMCDISKLHPAAPSSV